MKNPLPVLGLLFVSACATLSEQQPIEPTAPSTYCDGPDLVEETGIEVLPDGKAISGQNITANAPECS